MVEQKWKDQEDWISETLQQIPKALNRDLRTSEGSSDYYSLLRRELSPHTASIVPRYWMFRTQEKWEPGVEQLSAAK